MAEMAMVGSGSSRELGVSDGEGDAMLGGEKLPGPRAEAAVTRWTPVEAALNRMVSARCCYEAVICIYVHMAYAMLMLIGIIYLTVRLSLSFA